MWNQLLWKGDSWQKKIVPEFMTRQKVLQPFFARMHRDRKIANLEEFFLRNVVTPFLATSRGFNSAHKSLSTLLRITPLGNDVGDDDDNDNDDKNPLNVNHSEGEASDVVKSEFGLQNQTWLTTFLETLRFKLHELRAKFNFKRIFFPLKHHF